ncbi:unnamed protein product [marine sediment metagenome]|uniref:Uncharacterized protein n=1 Tax=marine sediment metagenome TaxID=412755 RepID=X0YY39_9ZZZZ
MYNQPVETYVGTVSTLVDDGAQLVYWIFVQPTSPGTAATVKIYDGISTQGKEVCRIAVGYGRMNSFFPPIRCSVGLYIEVNVGAATASYTVGFLSEKTALKQEFPIGS